MGKLIKSLSRHENSSKIVLILLHGYTFSSFSCENYVWRVVREMDGDI